MKHLFLCAVIAFGLSACAPEDPALEQAPAAEASQQESHEHDDTDPAGHDDAASGDDAELMSPEEEKDALHKEDPIGTYGRSLESETFGTISDLLASADENEGKLVRVAGEVTDVCPMRGCWMDVTDGDGEKIQVKVVDGAIVFPLSAKGHSADVEGTLAKLTYTEEEALAYRAHLAEERGETFDPESAPKGPMVMWRIEGRGAVIGD